MNRRTLIKATAGAALGAGLGAGTGLLPAEAAQAARTRFPPGFLWGTATSAYQVEGRFGRSADCIWDIFAHTPGKIRDGGTGDVACDDYHRYAADMALMARAGIKAYRFSIAWARVLPDGRGRPDPKGLDYYDRLVDTALEAGIEPWVCVYHWDLPQALQQKGGWGTREIAPWFAEYASLMAAHLGDRAKRWIMLNEPSVQAIIGYGLGQQAPGLTDRAAMFATLHHQNLAQGMALAALRQQYGSRLELGSVLSLQPAHPVGGLPQNVPAAGMWDALWNRACLDPLLRGSYPKRLEPFLGNLVQPGDLAVTRQKIDFLGVNYYSPMYQQADPAGIVGTAWGALPPGMKKTGMGWPIAPEGLREMLTRLRDDYGNPVLYVTENGASFPDAVGPSGRVQDDSRIAFLRDHIRVCRQAIADGVDLRGYFVWSILDNFEWAEGYTAPFGLVRVDRATLARTPKASYEWYANVARTGIV
jgi:beta-glucosidase